MPAKPYSSFSMGKDTFEVSMKLFEENRRRLREAIREKSKTTNNSQLLNSIVLLQGGDEINDYHTDTSPVFRQEPYFHWSFGVTEVGFYGAINIGTNESILFMPRLPDSYGVWMGKLLKPDDFREKYNVSSVSYVDEMSQTLSDLRPSLLLTLKGTNTDSDLKVPGASFNGIEIFNVDTSILFPVITELRVIKTPMEQEVLRYVNKLSSDAHRRVMQTIKPGMYEYQGEATFLHYCYYVGGCRHVAYTCICGSGDNGSILHYGHAGSPNVKRLNDGDMCLFDMGANYCGYASDITCSFPANGKFTNDQKIIYNAVLKARNAVLNAMRPKVNWVDMHILANKTMLQEMKEQGLLKGEVDEMFNDGLAAIFQPHGLGHLIGIDVHDVGGYMDYNPPRPEKPGLKSLRTARNLEAGMFITVEPGCYFIDMLLDKALNDPILGKYLTPVIERFRGFGGIRIEDDVLVTETGCQNFTNVPRTVEEIEDWMSDRKDVIC